MERQLLAPGARLSRTIRRFSATGQRRRASTLLPSVPGRTLPSSIAVVPIFAVVDTTQMPTSDRDGLGNQGPGDKATLAGFVQITQQ